MTWFITAQRLFKISILVFILVDVDDTIDDTKFFFVFLLCTHDLNSNYEKQYTTLMIFRLTYVFGSSLKRNN